MMPAIFAACPKPGNKPININLLNFIIMKKNEIKAAAMNLYATTASAKEIKSSYAALADKYGKDAARAIVDEARAIRAKQVEQIADLRQEVIATIDKNALTWEFEGLKKDKQYKALAGRAACKCADVIELVARWYPHTIEGVPAMRKLNHDGVRVWVKKSKINASSTLKACLRQIAKCAKGAKFGTTLHTDGEIVK